MKWTPVAERLPGPDERVIAVTARGEVRGDAWCAEQCDWDDEGREVMRRHWYMGDCWDLGGVTHWMPLPHPPEKENIP